jgi:DNA-binding NarL/FixJ family response regulator
MKTRILLVDDHELVRRGIRAVLEAEKTFEVCCEATDGREAVEKARALNADVVVMDIGLPGLNGIEATRQIRRLARGTRVLILSLHEAEHFAQEAFAAGAAGYVFKSDAAQEVVAAVRTILAGQPYLTKRLAGGLGRIHPKKGAAKQKRSGGLTRRELEVLHLLAEGHTNKSMAEVLGISVKTAETHRARLMRKLKLKSVAELVRYAIRERIILEV